MTQHPFDHEFSEEEVAKLKAEQQTNSEDELNEEDLEEVSGGIFPGLTDGIYEGGITAGWMEGGGFPWKGGNDLPTKK